MTRIDIRQCAIGAATISAVLFLTGLITVPFVNSSASQWLSLVIEKDSPNFVFIARQLENLIYAIGRLPILFSCMMALKLLQSGDKK
jgi:hypothetical protein